MRRFGGVGFAAGLLACCGSPQGPETDLTGWVGDWELRAEGGGTVCWDSGELILSFRIPQSWIWEDGTLSGQEGLWSIGSTLPADPNDALQMTGTIKPSQGSAALDFWFRSGDVITFNGTASPTKPSINGEVFAPRGTLSLFSDCASTGIGMRKQE